MTRFELLRPFLLRSLSFGGQVGARNDGFSVVTKIIRYILMKGCFIGIIKIYQIFLSPFFGGHCRFYPSCSDYAIVSIREKGIIAGFIKSFFRLLRCNPFFSGGYGPVDNGTVAKCVHLCHSERGPKGEAKNLDDDEILRSACGLPQNDKKGILQQSHNKRRGGI